MPKAFLPLPLRSDNEAGLKVIVGVSSMAALASRPGGSAYQTTKSAILKFAEFVMVEYAEQGVLCYAVHPPRRGGVGEGFDDAGWRGTCRSRRVAVHFSSSGDVDRFVARMVTIASLECRVEPASDPGNGASWFEPLLVMNA